MINYLEQRVIASGNPRQFGKSLSGDMGELWSYRVGDYRIISLIEDERLVIVGSAIGATSIGDAPHQRAGHNLLPGRRS